ncbi:MAG: FKBP-type peptidyl-prolyl cis-trans isomerase [Fimbriimonadaceae bacterium]
MNRLLTFTVAFSVLFGVGCSKSPGEKSSDPPPKTAAEPVDGLKTLGIKDTLVGKPSEFVKNMAPADLGDRLYMRYKGYLKAGTVFDRNDSDGRVYPITLGSGENIKGWDEGLIGMQIGGKRKLDIPWIKGYGVAGSQNIPGKTDLFFDVELIDMVKKDHVKTYHIIDRVKGTGAEAKRNSTVTVEYEMRAAGQSRIVDSSKIQGKPAEFQIGSEKMIIAIEDAVIGMRVGGTREARVPPGLCRIQTNTLQGVPEETVWYFKLKLLSVK